MLVLPPPAGDEAIALARGLGVTRTAAAVLCRARPARRRAGRRFLDPRLAHLTRARRDERPRARRSLAWRAAARAQERVCVFGDYDADGVTAAALRDRRAARARRRGRPRSSPTASTAATGSPAPALARVRDTGASLARHVRLRLERPRAARRRCAAAGIDADRHRPPPRSRGAAAGPGVPQPSPARVRLPLQGPRVGGPGPLHLRRRAHRARRRARHATLARSASPSGPSGTSRPSTATTDRSCARASARSARWSSPRHARPGRDGRLRERSLRRARTSPSVSPRASTPPGASTGPICALALLLATTDEEARRLAAEVEVHSARGARRSSAPCSAEALDDARGPGARGPARRSCSASRGGTRASSGSWPGGSCRASASPPWSSRSTARSGRGSARAPAGFSVYDALARVARRARRLRRSPRRGRRGGGERPGGRLPRALRRGVRRHRGAHRHARAATPTPCLEPGDAPARVVARPRRASSRAARPTPRPASASSAPACSQTREVRGGHLRAWLDVGGQPAVVLRRRDGRRSPASWATRARVVGVLRRDTWTGGGAVEMRLLAAEPA